MGGGGHYHDYLVDCRLKMFCIIIISSVQFKHKQCMYTDTVISLQSTFPLSVLLLFRVNLQLHFEETYKRFNAIYKIYAQVAISLRLDV